MGAIHIIGAHIMHTDDIYGTHFNYGDQRRHRIVRNGRLLHRTGIYRLSFPVRYCLPEQTKFLAEDQQELGNIAMQCWHQRDQVEQKNVSVSHAPMLHLTIPISRIQLHPAQRSRCRPPHRAENLAASRHEDRFIATEFCNSLTNALLQSQWQHVIAIMLSLNHASIFAFRLFHNDTKITCPLIRGLLSTSAFLYFPSLALSSSVVITVLLFLLRQTGDVQMLIQRLCDAVTDPMVDRFSVCTQCAIGLQDLQTDLERSASCVQRREALVTMVGRKCSLHALVCLLTTCGMRAALAALACVVESRFRDSVGSSESARVMRLSRSVVIAILRAEIVSAVLLPLKAGLTMYLYGTLVVAALLMSGPLWLLW